MKISQYTEYKINKEKPKYLVVLLHGYGSNKDDLITIAPELANYIPEACFISPNAPYKCENMDIIRGFQWFSLINRDLKNMLQGAKAATPILEDFIKIQLQRLDIKEENLVLLGFSQGTMMSLYISLVGQLTPKAILGYSGLSLVGSGIVKKEKNDINIALIHGKDDLVIPISEMRRSYQELKQSGIHVVKYEHSNLAHGINEEGIVQGGQFLKKHLG